VAPGFCPVSDCCFRHENTARKGGATKSSQAHRGPRIAIATETVRGADPTRCGYVPAQLL